MEFPIKTGRHSFILHREAIAAKRTLDEADVRYRSGIDPYLNVITAQIALLTAQESALTVRQQRITATMQLVAALSGGWDVSQLR